MLILDGISYDVPVLDIKRTADFLDKHAGRTQTGDLRRELLGVFINYELQIGTTTNTALYQALWDKLTEPVEFHEVTVPDETGAYTFTAYFARVGDELRKELTVSLWKGLTVNFKAKAPKRVPA